MSSSGWSSPPPTPAPPTPALRATVGELIERGVRRIHVLAWRDLDDPDAGGSEVHADEFLRRWAAAGLDITHRTSVVVGHEPTRLRNGYRVDRAGNRYTVFPRAIVDEMRGAMGDSDALVEIWNGVPWMSPIWYRKPRLTFVHHVHGPMWDQIFPVPLAWLGRSLETRLAPPWYRRTAIVTPSEATRDELVAGGLRPDRVTAIANGVDGSFRPGGHKSEEPSLIAVGRLAPVKRFAQLIAQAAIVKQTYPTLTLTIIGDGPERSALQRLAAEVQASGSTSDEWIQLPGRVDHDELVAQYQRAWLVVSASLAEGWGLSLTEAAACGTPAVATDIAGHRSSVIDGVTGTLAPVERLGSAMLDVLADPARLESYRAAALARSAELSWDRTAEGIAGVLLGEVRRSAATT